MLRSDIIKRFRIDKGRGFRLDRHDPANTCGLDLDKDEAQEILANSAKELAKLQEKLFADRRWAVLVILQGLDASGKDSMIEHVLSGINPQGCEVHAFGPPTEAELAHDFLWRTTRVLPPRGHIGIFNRSYYEETLVVRVHPEILERQNLPDTGDRVWEHRFDAINAHERHLGHNGVLVLKFFLNISKEEQARRLLARIDEQDKNWKFQPGDLVERRLWDKYQHAYQELIRNTATGHTPWHVVPADHKWFARLVVSATLMEQIEALDLRYPTVNGSSRRVMHKARAELLADLPNDEAKELSRRPKKNEKEEKNGKKKKKK